MNYTQMKMARAALGWSTHELAKQAKVARVTVARFEAGDTISDESLAKIESVLIDAGADFTDRAGRIGVTVPK